MSFFQSHLPTYSRPFRWFFRWRILRRFLLGLAILFTLTAVYLTEERLRGEHAWKTYKDRLIAQGQWVDFAALQPPPVPDDQNFYATPLMQAQRTKGSPVADAFWKKQEAATHALEKLGLNQFIRTDLPDRLSRLQGATLASATATLATLAPELDELATASRRPAAVLPMDPNTARLYGPSPMLFTLSPFYAMRAEIALANGQTNAATEELLTLFHLAQAQRTVPNLTAQLIAAAMTLQAIPVIREGLDRHLWSDAQLVALIAPMQPVDYLAWVQFGLRAYQAAENTRFEYAIAHPADADPDYRAIVELCPRGWVYQNLIEANRYFTDLFAVFIPHHQLDMPALSALDQRARQLRQGRWSPNTFLAAKIVGYLDGFIDGAGANQDAFSEALLACALERYRLAHGQFPEKLVDLTPEYLPAVPTSVFDGQPIHYHLQAKGGYVLTSPGPNSILDDFDDIKWVYPSANAPNPPPPNPPASSRSAKTPSAAPVAAGTSTP